MTHGEEQQVNAKPALDLAQRMRRLGDAVARDRAAPYAQIADHYRKQIKSGALAPGDHLPPLRVMTETWKVSRQTVDRALACLKAEGLVRTSGRGGTTVREPGPRAKAAPGWTAALYGAPDGTCVLLTFAEYDMAPAMIPVRQPVRPDGVARPDVTELHYLGPPGDIVKHLAGAYDRRRPVQQALAEYIGVSQQAISGYLKRGFAPDAIAWPGLARAWHDQDGVTAIMVRIEAERDAAKAARKAERDAATR